MCPPASRGHRRIAGCAYFLWRRFPNREATTGHRLGYDLLPLVALVGISAAGLLVTLSPRASA
jgi:CRISPR-associated Cas5-like protein